ncbi:MAG: adenylyl-sulfate kinase [Melioribacteraceae bacterium]|nr:adenylyl-sulfate kinase [Melioribacteraceae bacterium]MCF8263504.1 adenylyl-sulfate kinase [Melioribacteraceae bacterium]MCF8296942.1 adenylyl-sulfate kinase [Saprospiraceae bacterium]
MFKETHARSVVKTISWRILATVTTITLVYIFIGDTTIAISVGGIEVFLKMLIYFLHERAWDKIKFGRKEVKPAVIWITGLVRSGKSEIGEKVTQILKEKGFKADHLDGHGIRHLFPETGYSHDEVNEHIKRVGYLASKLEEQGVFVIATFLSPFEESRNFIRSIAKNFIEVYISTPIEECIKRDTTGTYEKAKKGEISNFPGISTEYEIPKNPELEFENLSPDTDKIALKIVEFALKDF